MRSLITQSQPKKKGEYNKCWTTKENPRSKTADALCDTGKKKNSVSVFQADGGRGGLDQRAQFKREVKKSLKTHPKKTKDTNASPVLEKTLKRWPSLFCVCSLP